MADMRGRLAEFGAEPTALRLLDEESPQLLPYATLMTARRNGDTELGLVEAVYEWQDSPLIFLIDGDSLEDDEALLLKRRLATWRSQPVRVCLVRSSLTSSRRGWGRASRESHGERSVTVPLP